MDWDTQIGELIRAGDYKAALSEMTALYHLSLVRFCTGFTGSSMEAEEIVQEVFLQAWESMPRFRGDSTTRVWLFGIARRLCSRHMRRKNRRFSLFQRWLEGQPKQALCDGALEGLERKELLERALQRLKPKLREAVLLRYQLGMDNGELAEALGIRPAAARKRVSLGIQALREWLQPLLDEATPAQPPPRPPARPLQVVPPEEQSWPAELWSSQS